MAKKNSSKKSDTTAPVELNATTPAVANNEEDTAMTTTAPTKSFRITAEDVAAASVAQTRKGKDVNHNSGRQRILQILKASEVPLTPAQINAQIERFFGEKMKWVSSHLDYFRKNGQVEVSEKGKYVLAASMVDRVADLTLPEEGEVQSEPTDEPESELVEA